MNETVLRLTEIFSNTVADYNQSTIVLQMFIFILGFALTIALYKRPNKLIKVLIKLFLSFCFAWISVAFFLINGSPEFKNPITASLYAVISLGFFFDIFINTIKFERNHKYDKWVYLFYFLYLAYPFISILIGRRFPIMTTWIMPCPIAVYTISLLVSYTPKINYFILLLLTIWGLIALPKGFFIWEDFILGFAGILGLVVIVKEVFYFLRPDN
jgi:hypothetical protein